MGLAAHRTTDQKAEAAALFVDWLTEAERNLKFVADTGYMPVRVGAFEGIDLDTYEFPEESYVALYSALKDAQERYTPVSEPNFAGYYDSIYTLYDGLRQMQRELPVRAAAGEDVEGLAEETWAFFRSVR